MIPIIGIMIGLYILTRMLEVLTGSAKRHVKVFAGITAIGNVIGIVSLMTSSFSLGDLTALDPESAAVDALGSTVDLDSLVAGLDTDPTWQLSESVSPLDDSPTVVLQLQASSGMTRTGETPTLVLRCSENETAVYVSWSEYMGSTRTIEVTTRIGKASAQTERWLLSTNNTATFYPDTPIRFIKALMAVDTVVFRATPYSESPITAVFAISGLAEEIRPLQTACGWQ